MEYVLYFGRFSAEKGINTLVDVCQCLPDIPFIFAGSGPLEDEINTLSNVRNVGFKSGIELEKLIRGAQFSVCPSRAYDNCPFSVMESQMYGTPVIGANIGGIPELIRVNETGELFESGNIKELKEKIERLWGDRELIDQYSRNCRNINFDNVAEYTEKLMRIYRGKN